MNADNHKYIREAKSQLISKTNSDSISLLNPSEKPKKRISQGSKNSLFKNGQRKSRKSFPKNSLPSPKDIVNGRFVDIPNNQIGGSTKQNEKLLGKVSDNIKDINDAIELLNKKKAHYMNVKNILEDEISKHSDDKEIIVLNDINSKKAPKPINTENMSKNFTKVTITSKSKISSEVSNWKNEKDFSYFHFNEDPTNCIVDFFVKNQQKDIIYNFSSKSTVKEDGDIIMKGDNNVLNENEFHNFEGFDNGVIMLSEYSSDNNINVHQNNNIEESIIKEAPADEEQTNKKNRKDNINVNKKRTKSTNESKDSTTLNKLNLNENMNKNLKSKNSKDKELEINIKSKTLKSMDNLEKKSNEYVSDELNINISAFKYKEEDTNAKNVNKSETETENNIDNDNVDKKGKKKNKKNKPRKKRTDNSNRSNRSSKSSKSLTIYNSIDSSESFELEDEPRIELMDEETCKIYIKQYGIKPMKSVNKMRERLGEIVNFYSNKELPKYIYNCLVNFTKGQGGNKDENTEEESNIKDRKNKSKKD